MEAQLLDYDGHRARARHHHQEPGRARHYTGPTTGRSTSSTSSTPPATSTSPTRCRRSLAACEGAVLVVDATQGVEAQTVSNALLAMNAGLEILPAHQQDRPAELRRASAPKPRLRRVSPSRATRRCRCRARRATASTSCSRPWCATSPRPRATPDAPLKALIFDSYFDAYRGVVALVRVIDGSLRTKARRCASCRTISSSRSEEVGVRRPAETPLPELTVGEVGYMVTGLKDPLSRTRGRHGDRRRAPHRRALCRATAR